MIDIDTVIKEVAKRTKVDIDTVSMICKHPFQIAVQVMKDEDDERDILFNTLLKFKLKRRYKNNKTKEFSSK